MTEKKQRFTYCNDECGINSYVKENNEILGETYDSIEAEAIVKRLNELYDENEQLKQTSQDYEDIVYNWFINNWDKLSDEMKQSAHLEVGIDIEYGSDYE